ncbi:hypothetical protein ATANTOWER_028480, partial [Ataeniobius toweri]|nr:hypothetical protein [Ataeniobius toweri]
MSQPIASHKEVRDGNSRSSSTPRLLHPSFQQNARHDDNINTDGHMSNSSTNGEEEVKNSSSEDEFNNENSPTTTLMDKGIQENKEAMSYSEEDLSDAANNEGENHAGNEAVMEGNRTREKTPELPVGSEDQADGDNPL